MKNRVFLLNSVKSILVSLVTLFSGFFLFTSCGQTQVEKDKKLDRQAAWEMAIVGDIQKKASVIINPTDNCKGCHSETTDIGSKILWAKAGWDESVHKNGYLKELNSLLPTNTITSNTWTVIGYEWEGSDAFYSNGGGCQVCHTKEGFRKKVAGTYGVGLSGTNLDLKTIHNLGDAVSKDVIAYPSAISCFACHSPHEKGSFELLVPNGTKVTTETGSQYTKSKGSICASCHVVRMGGKATVAEIIQGYASVAATANLNPRIGPHHGPQTDMLLGKGGAEIPGKTYTNSAHTVIDGANCQSCHQVDDFNNSGQTSGDSLSPAVGGHSFAITGVVHGSPKGIAKGCKSSSCHSVSGSANMSSDNGHKLKGDAYLYVAGTSSSPTPYFTTLNAAIKAMSDPTVPSVTDTDLTACGGLIEKAVATMGGKVKFTTYPDGKSTNKRCVLVSDTGSLTVKGGGSGVVVNGIDNVSKLVRAIWNYRFVIGDKSFGVHNYKYATQLLVDSCNELNGIVVASGITCPDRP
jgi:hypothetical protein